LLPKPLGKQFVSTLACRIKTTQEDGEDLAPIDVGGIQDESSASMYEDMSSIEPINGIKGRGLLLFT
jgi:hypothetical protein